eukprot:6093432-Pleurochrysis_carterae.AAC.2
MSLELGIEHSSYLRRVVLAREFETVLQCSVACMPMTSWHMQSKYFVVMFSRASLLLTINRFEILPSFAN